MWNVADDDASPRAGSIFRTDTDLLWCREKFIRCHLSLPLFLSLRGNLHTRIHGQYLFPARRFFQGRESLSILPGVSQMAIAIGNSIRMQQLYLYFFLREHSFIFRLIEARMLPGVFIINFWEHIEIEEYSVRPVLVSKVIGKIS